MSTSFHIVVERHGDPSVLCYKRREIPEPLPDEVCVKVDAAGVGYSDIMAQRGGYPLAPKPPFTPGYDLVGTIIKVGSKVDAFSVGESVAALNPGFGCYSQHVCIQAKYLVPIPRHLDKVEVCSLVLNYLTAYCLLHKKAKVKAGDSVLIHSAAGGVGTALIQLCNIVGVNVIGTASASKHKIVEKLGATAIDYQTQDFVSIIKKLHPEGVDAVFDPFGGKHLNRSYSTIKPGGVAVSYGFAGDNFGGLMPMIAGTLQLGCLKLIPDRKKVKLCALPAECKRDTIWYKETLAMLVDFLESGKIKPLVGAQFPLSEASKAHELIEQSAISGKVVLCCQ